LHKRAIGWRRCFLPRTRFGETFDGRKKADEANELIEGGCVTGVISLYGIGAGPCERLAAAKVEGRLMS
jgi:hypothetical protein